MRKPFREFRSIEGCLHPLLSSALSTNLRGDIVRNFLVFAIGYCVDSIPVFRMQYETGIFGQNIGRVCPNQAGRLLNLYVKHLLGIIEYWSNA